MGKITITMMRTISIIRQGRLLRYSKKARAKVNMNILYSFKLPLCIVIRYSRKTRVNANVNISYLWFQTSSVYSYILFKESKS